MNYFVKNNLNLYNMDCMDLMQKYPDNYFDLAIVDPPYGIGKFTCESSTDKNGKRRQNNKKKFLDDYKWNESIPDNKYFQELIRVSKKRIVWGSNYYPIVDGSGGSLVWYKGKMTKTISACEIASISFQTKVDYVCINWQSGFYRTIKEGEQIHPCQKPVKLYKWLLINYAKDGDKILDTHLGSGSIAIACHDMNFNLTGCEIDQDYFIKMCERINIHTAQLQLF
jgi:site-specific DNA-methyltransferase (adenine-specific)